MVDLRKIIPSYKYTMVSASSSEYMKEYMRQYRARKLDYVESNRQQVKSKYIHTDKVENETFTYMRRLFVDVETIEERKTKHKVANRRYARNKYYEHRNDPDQILSDIRRLF